ncbi:hypothetical protein FLM55_01650 [Francisella sp. Scap27]|uniref:hypothetical protein n=1 Tax=Francisella sp. Scap27 TaxID=2589986 RepID=UPI0015B92EB8|nr:hypothetical protein [Francisella sp. Scap27]QLE78513.1 hypothetical protein FLM55_01650 [Francisella sp. Scap27]
MITHFFYIKKVMGNSYNITSTGCLIVFTDSIVYKLPLSKSAECDLKKSFESYKILKKAKSQLVEYSYKKINKLYIMPKLQLLNSIKEKDVRSVVEKIQSISPVKEECSKSYFYKYSYKRSFPLVENIIEALKGSIRLSFSHGDLTPSNIMSYKEKKVLIDLDRLAMLPNFFDLYHYKIEKHVKNNNINFLEYLENAFKYSSFDDAFTRENLIIYFMQRVFLENRDSVCLPDIYIERVQKICSLIAQKGSDKCIF